MEKKRLFIMALLFIGTVGLLASIFSIYLVIKFTKQYEIMVTETPISKIKEKHISLSDSQKLKDFDRIISFYAEDSISLQEMIRESINAYYELITMLIGMSIGVLLIGIGYKKSN